MATWCRHSDIHAAAILLFPHLRSQNYVLSHLYTNSNTTDPPLQPVFETIFATKKTYTPGEQFTLPAMSGPAPSFKEPVDIVVGRDESPSCLGQRIDQAAATNPALYPNVDAVGSRSLTVRDCGHSSDAHYVAGEAFEQMIEFLDANGF